MTVVARREYGGGLVALISITISREVCAAQGMMCA